MEIGLSLGSNLGDRPANLKEAARRIAAIPGVSLTARSAVYESSPVDTAPEHRDMPFLNAALLIEAELHPRDLLVQLQSIERAMGRLPGGRPNAPRIIDIDIIYAGALCIDSGPAIVPHPRWMTRRFVVLPLQDLRPDLMLPGQTLPLAELLLSLPAEQEVIRYTPGW